MAQPSVRSPGRSKSQAVWGQLQFLTTASHNLSGWLIPREINAACREPSRSTNQLKMRRKSKPKAPKSRARINIDSEYPCLTCPREDFRICSLKFQRWICFVGESSCWVCQGNQNETKGSTFSFSHQGLMVLRESVVPPCWALVGTPLLFGFP